MKKITSYYINKESTSKLDIGVYYIQQDEDTCVKTLHFHPYEKGIVKYFYNLKISEVESFNELKKGLCLSQYREGEMVILKSELNIHY